MKPRHKVGNNVEHSYNVTPSNISHPFKPYVVEYTVEYGRREFNSLEQWQAATQGTLHREDGPALIYSSGVECYYLEGELVASDSSRK
jgi:hypothetical protein